ncbi:hypothetical protein AB0M50_30425 [Nonomuraea fuscirosea]|uniref:hypothetical protein n=1 Tax=Nonomuraea fuscirosea TaxID=1291556 RepID=UPI002DDA5BEC|nr:hypothetical protein [Nonomuraea fuscirosea]WSA56620.1 hypothetical protein OIE67_18995 [Nonomuraea fuscirosea]
MTSDSLPAEPMPALVRAARVVLIVQVAASVLGLVVMGGVLAAAASAPSLFLLLFLLPAVVLVVMVWLVLRWSSRRSFVRWAAVAVEAVLGGGNLVSMLVAGRFVWASLPLSVLLPLGVAGALLTAPAARWFNR